MMSRQRSHQKSPLRATPRSDVLRSPAISVAATLLLTLITARPAPGAEETTGAPVGYTIWGGLTEFSEGARVELSALEAPPDEAVHAAAVDRGGLYQISGVEGGMWRLTARAPGRLAMAIELAPLLSDRGLAEVELPGLRTLELEIIGPDGEPRGGAAVTLRAALAPSGEPFSPPQWRPLTQTVLSDASGVAFLDAADDVLFDLLVTADGAVPKVLERISTARRAIRLEAGDDQEILFRSAGGQGLSGVRIELGNRWTLATSDESGSARLALPAGKPLEVSYEAGDRRRPGERLSRDPEGGAAFVLMPPPAAVGGRIVDARTREVVAGAWVWPIGSPARGARGDGQGTYLVSGLHPSESWFIAAAEGYRPTIVQAHPAWGAPAEAPAVALQPATTIRGRAVAADGRPIPKARIEVEALAAPRGSRMQAPVNASLLTAADGSFSASALLPQTRYRVTAGKEGWAPSSVVLPAAAPGLRDLEPLVLTRGASLVGQVVDGAGGGVTGTRLLLVPERGHGPSELAIRGTSAEDGLYSLREVPPGSYRLSAEHPDFAVAVVPGIAVQPDVAELELPAIELRRGASLEGIVLDAESSPLAGAEVTWLEPGVPASHSRLGATPPAVLSGADGGFRIEQLQPGVGISLEVILEGYAPTTLHGLDIPNAELVEVVLEAEASLSGRVTTVDGHVLEKAAVSLSSAGSNPGEGIAEALSDADGRFRLPGLPAGSFELLVSAVGFQQHREKVEDLRAGESRSDLDVELDAGGVVRGVVLEPDGSPAPAARVSLLREGPGGAGYFPTYHGTETDGDGRFRLAGLPLGEQILAADHPAFPRLIRRLPISRSGADEQFRLRAGSRVSGRVIDTAGESVAGARVLIVSQDAGFEETASEADGTFLFAGVDEGTYELAGEKEGSARSIAPEPVEVRAQVDVTGLELRLETGRTVEGVVLGVDTALLGRLRVTAEHRFLGRRPGVVDAGGRFVVESLAAGDWLVEAKLESDGRNDRQIVSIEADVDPPLLELDLGSGLLLTGIVYVDGEAKSGAAVSARGTDVADIGTTRTGPDGRFELKSLRRGNYWIEVKDEAIGLKYREPLELLRDESIEISVRSGAIAGVIVDASTAEPIADAMVTLAETGPGASRRVERSDATGYFVFETVSHGSWRLEAQSEGYRTEERQVTLDESLDVVDLEVELERNPGTVIRVGLSGGGRPREVSYGALSAAGERLAGGRAILDDAGRARLSASSDTADLLLVAASGTATAIVDLRASGQVPEVLLEPASRLLVRVPQEWPAASVRLLDAGERAALVLSADGRMVDEWRIGLGQVHIEGLRPGRYTVLVQAGGDEVGRTTAEVSGTQVNEVFVE